MEILLCPWRFSRQEYWSGLPCPPPRGLPNPGVEPRSPTLQVDSLPSEPPAKPMIHIFNIKKKSRDNAVIWFYLYVNSDCWYCLCLDTDKVSLSKHGGIMLGGRSFLLNRVKHVLLKIILKRKCLDFSCFKLVFSEFKALIWVTLKW